MQENDTKKTKLVAAICTQCGAQLDVDPEKEAAVCPYCGTPFIIEKAINNYNIQHAHIDHVDNVNVDLTGSVNSVLGFAERQLDQHREEKKQVRKEKQEENKHMMSLFFKMMIAMFIFAIFF